MGEKLTLSSTDNFHPECFISQPQKWQTALALCHSIGVGHDSWKHPRKQERLLQSWMKTQWVGQKASLEPRCSVLVLLMEGPLSVSQPP